MMATLSILASCQPKVQVASANRTAEKEPRTVFGELPKPDGARQRAVAASSVDRTNEDVREDSESKVASDRESPRETVARNTYRWAQTSTSRDLNRHLSLYARNLDRFYDDTNVKRDSVRREKQRSLRTSTPYSGQQIRDLSLRVQDEGRLVIAEFQREIIRAGIGKDTVHQRLVWKRLDGDWKIIREEAL